jgi:hypothetical protein
MASPCARGNDHTGDSDWPQDEDHGTVSRMQGPAKLAPGGGRVYGSRVLETRWTGRNLLSALSSVG